MINYNRQRVKLSAGVSIAPNDWNNTTQRANEIKDRGDLATINRILDGLKNEATRLFYTAKERGEINLSELKEKLEKFIGRKARGVPSVIAYTTLFIEGRENEMEGKKKKYQVSTIGTYKRVRRQLELFAKQSGKEDFRFQELNLEWVLSFRQFQFEQDMSIYSVQKNMLILSGILKQAIADGYSENRIFEHKQYNVKISKADDDKQGLDIYLKRDELIKLSELELQGGLDRARDGFLLGCATGMRFSDFSKLTSDNLLLEGETLYIQRVNQKTGKLVTLAVTDEIAAIIKKNNSGFPEPLSNQKMNEYLKEIGRLAGMNEPTRQYRNVGGEWIEIHGIKGDFLDSHTARRTAITNMKRKGMTTDDIMAFTGIESRKTVERYIKETPFERARRIGGLDELRKVN